MERLPINPTEVGVNDSDEAVSGNSPSSGPGEPRWHAVQLRNGRTTEFAIGPAHPGHPDYHILYDEKGNPRCDQDGNPLYLSYQPKKE